MGTNYYGVKTPTAEHLITIAKEVLNGNLGLVKIMLESFEQIHIGKNSVGWKFLFDHNNQEWSSIEDYKEFIKQHKITSEYGVEMSFDEFWNNVVDSKQSDHKMKNGADFFVDGYCFSNSHDFC